MQSGKKEPEKEVLSIREFFSERTERAFAVKSQDEAQTVLSTLGRDELLTYIQRGKVPRERIFSDHLLIPLEAESGDAVVGIYTHIPKEYFNQAWIFAYDQKTEKPEPVVRLQISSFGVGFTSLQLQIPSGYLREHLYLALYFHGREWQSSPRMDRVGVEYLVFQPWKRERIWKARLGEFNRGGFTLYPVNSGGWSIQKPLEKS